MRNYEMMFIVKSGLDADKVKEEVETLKKIITSGKGKVSKVDEMGQRKLAYPIKKEINGIYYVFTFECDKDTISELDRRIKINEDILRHLIIRLDEE